MHTPNEDVSNHNVIEIDDLSSDCLSSDFLALLNASTRVAMQRQKFHTSTSLAHVIKLHSLVTTEESKEKVFH